MRSGVLAAWARAWLAGSVSIDQVVDATTADDAPHHAVGSPGLEGLDLVPLRELLVLWRRQGGSPRLVLPAPGDVRGLPGPAGFRSAALEAGEAVVAGHLGAVPEVVEHAPSSAPSTVLWRVSATDAVPDDPIDLGEAQYELTTAIRESASTLHATETARWREEFGAGLTAARHAGECIDLPPGHPPARRRPWWPRPSGCRRCWTWPRPTRSAVRSTAPASPTGRRRCARWRSRSDEPGPPPTTPAESGRPATTRDNTR